MTNLCYPGLRPISNPTTMALMTPNFFCHKWRWSTISNKNPAIGFRHRGLRSAVGQPGEQKELYCRNLDVRLRESLTSKYGPRPPHTQTMVGSQNLSCQFWPRRRHCFVLVYFDFVDIAQNHGIPLPQETITEVHNYPYVHNYLLYPNECDVQALSGTLRLKVRWFHFLSDFMVYWM